MENDLVNYPLRIDRKQYKKLRELALKLDKDVRECLLDAIGTFMQRHSAEAIPKDPEADRKDRELRELALDFIKNGDAGQVELFKYALERHKKRKRARGVK